jgi:hypothetical protein
VKRSGFKRKPRTFKGVSNNILIKRKDAKPIKKTALEKETARLLKWQSPVETKKRIQALLRQIVIISDGGCLLRNDGVGMCSSVLQAEHLITRSRSATYADLRNIICLCTYHHGLYKPINGQNYWQLVEKHLRPKRWEWLKRAEADKKAYRFYASDWLMAENVLSEELNKLKKSEPDI